MNISLFHYKRQEYYIASVRCHANEKGRFVVFGKRIRSDGRFLETCASFEFDSQREATKKCRRLAKTKCHYGGYVRVPLNILPDKVQDYLDVPLDMQMTPQEMVAFLAEMRRERYVVFADVRGMEEWFDAGVQYVGYETDDPECMSVCDRFGDRRDCFRERIASMNPTEEAMKIRDMRGESE